MSSYKSLLFNKYSSNLGHICSAIGFQIDAALVATNEEKYLCPLSDLVFARVHLEKYKNHDLELTIEHVPQKSLGGKGICLTVKKSNNGSTKLDSSLLERYNFEDELSKGRYMFHGLIKHKFKSKVYFNKFNNRIEFHWKNLSNYIADSLLDFKKSGRITAKLSQINDNSKTVKLACLKNAFLLAFSTLGYGFIFGSKYIEHPIICKIREQLRKPNENILDLDFVFPTVNMNDELLGIFLCRTEKFSWLHVCYEIGKSDYKKRIAVLFPLASHDNFDFLTELNSNSEKTFSAFKIENVDLTTEAGSLYYWDICDQL